jgi:hypothetical protein
MQFHGPGGADGAPVSPRVIAANVPQRRGPGYRESLTPERTRNYFAALATASRTRPMTSSTSSSRV